MRRLILITVTSARYALDCIDTLVRGPGGARIFLYRQNSTNTMVLTLNDAIDAAKRVLDNAGYAYYVVTSTEVSSDNSQWIVKINSILGRRTVFVDRNTGEVLRITADEQQD